MEATPVSRNAAGSVVVIVEDADAVDELLGVDDTLEMMALALNAR